MENNKKRSCFIITPIGNENTEIRRMADGVILSVLKPILSNAGYEVIDSRNISNTGSITNQIMIHILNDYLVIANLTGLNPNVMYELAVRHSTAKPVITICQEETILPFDIRDERTIFYKNDMKGVVELVPQLLKAIDSIKEDDKNMDNPIYRARAYFQLLNNTDNDNMKIIIQSSLNLSDAIIQSPKFENRPVPHQENYDSWNNLRELMRHSGKTKDEIEESINNVKKIMENNQK